MQNTKQWRSFSLLLFSFLPLSMTSFALVCCLWFELTNCSLVQRTLRVRDQTSRGTRLVVRPGKSVQGIRHATNHRYSAKPCRVLSSVCAALSLREVCFASLCCSFCRRAYSVNSLKTTKLAKAQRNESKTTLS